MGKRADELFAVGFGTVALLSDRDQQLLRAFAAMLDAALPPSRKVGSKVKPARLSAFTASDVYDLLKAQVPDAFLYDPQSKQWFINLNRKINKVKWPEDLPDKILQWFQTGRGATFSKRRLSFGVLVENFEGWAREAMTGEQTLPDLGITFLRTK